MRAIPLPKYHDYKVALRPESYIVFTTKVSRLVEAWQWMPPPKTRNAKICRRKTFMISHIFLGIKASSLVLNTTPLILFLLLMYFFHIWFIIYRHGNSLVIQYLSRGSDLNVYWFSMFFLDDFNEQDHFKNN